MMSRCAWSPTRTSAKWRPRWTHCSRGTVAAALALFVSSYANSTDAALRVTYGLVVVVTVAVPFIPAFNSDTDSFLPSIVKRKSSGTVYW